MIHTNLQRSILTLVVVACLDVCAFAQNSSAGSTLRTNNERHSDRTSSARQTAIEVTNDRFTAKRTVRLRPQRLCPTLEMSLTGEVETARRPDLMGQDLGVMVTAQFSAVAEQGTGPFEREMELNFLVDGRRTMRSPATDGFSTDVRRQDGRRTATAMVSQSVLEQVARGRRVELRVGTLEATLDEATIANIRAFVADDPALRRAEASVTIF